MEYSPLSYIQSVAIMGSADIDYLKLTSSEDTALSLTYKAVYLLTRQFAATANVDFIDLSSLYVNCDHFYIDFWSCRTSSPPAVNG